MITLEQWKEQAIDNHILPLQTLQSMAERWGRSKQAVNNFSMRDPEFPKQLEGAITKTSRTPRVYPLYEVERYEKLRGLKK